MHRLLVLSLIGLGLLVGCGGQGGGGSSGTGGTHTETLPLGAEATGLCLGEKGFLLRPAASGVSAVSPSDKEFTVSFFSTEAAASHAAGGAAGSTAIANAVVTPKGKRLTSQELATVERCVRGR
jgi:hypothetical protein